MEYRRYPLNAVGDFYVVEGVCLACTAPEHEAPELMSHDPSAQAGYHCYFKRQPTTPEEMERAIRAVEVGCCGAVRYGGRDSRIIMRLNRVWFRGSCDHASGTSTLASSGED